MTAAELEEGRRQGCYAVVPWPDEPDMPDRPDGKDGRADGKSDVRADGRADGRGSVLKHDHAAGLKHDAAGLKRDAAGLGNAERPVKTAPSQEAEASLKKKKKKGSFSGWEIWKKHQS